MSLHLWSDNETEQDLLGFRVHVDLIRAVVTDPALLPITLGVFGDWGGGKSSIMRMLKADFGTTAYENVVCLYFNGWAFEGYEDAKSALLTSILVGLGEHTRFGPKVRNAVIHLLKRVKWMEAGKLALKVGLPVLAGLATGGVGAAAVAGAAIAASVHQSKEGHSEGTPQKTEGVHWADLIEKSPGKPELMEVRKFRDDFQKMLEDTDISALVILIDDLDRCLPDRIIETLEAIKLFLSVPKTSFVIGADPRIVRHAIGCRYVNKQLPIDATSDEEQYDLIKDYLEKLIQVPYHLPRLSPAEIETYMNLLACVATLPADRCGVVLSHWAKSRKANFYAAYGRAGIAEALTTYGALPPTLEAQLAWSNAIAAVVTEGLKGNPRQVKRMLNAMSLRKELATVANLDIRDEVLAKLMVLEYSEPALFRQLNEWQTTEAGLGTPGVPLKVTTPG